MAFDDFDYEENPVEDASMSRVSYVAEPPTDPSRIRALQQATQEEKLMQTAPTAPAPGPAAQPTLSKPTLEKLGSRTAPIDRGIPFVDLPRALNPDAEFDRLVREKLEGQHTDRAHLKSRVKNLADSHLAWQWQALDAVMGGGAAVWEGLRSGGNRLLGTLPDIEAAATCKRVNQAKPIVIDLDDDEAEGTQPRRMQSRDPGDDFSDLVASAAKEPIPARIPRAEMPSETPQGREGLMVSDVATTLDAEAAASKKTRPGDAKSCLAPSTAMTSSAASSLGALFAKNDGRPATDASSGQAALSTVQEDEEPATVEAKPTQSSKAKSVLAQSTVMSSSAAGALGSLLAKSSPSTRPPEATDAPEASASTEPLPKKSSGAKSVLNQSTAMTSSAAGALGGLLNPGASSPPPARTVPESAEDASSTPPPAKKASGAKSVLNQSSMTEPPATSSSEPGTTATATDAPPPKKSSGAKSVLNQSAMTSSAAGALSGLLAQGGPKSSAPRPEGSASDASTAAPKRSPDDRKSALAASTVMTSSAAATLGALAAPKAKPKDPAPAPATQAASSDVGAAPAPKPKAARPKGESKTVISGLNTSSAASALLGPMVQAKK